MPGFIDLTGQLFGRLTVIGRVESRFSPQGKPRTHWLCSCACGNSATVNVAKLRNGHTRSCGCLQPEATGNANRTHGQRHTRAYNSWSAMKARCYSPTCEKYRIYGARGITVDARWRDSFANFLADMGQPPDGMSLERNDTNGHYTKSNCRWATPLEQASNLRTTVRLTYDGKTDTLRGWAARLGTTHNAIRLRLAKGATFPEVVAAFTR